MCAPAVLFHLSAQPGPRLVAVKPQYDPCLSTTRLQAAWLFLYHTHTYSGNLFVCFTVFEDRWGSYHDELMALGQGQWYASLQLCMQGLIKTTYLHPRKSAKGPWKQENFNVTRQLLKALNLILAWCICKFWLLPSWSAKCEQKLRLYPLQSQKVGLAGSSLHVWKRVNDWCFLSMVSSWNIYLHFPWNVGIFHPM